MARPAWDRFDRSILLRQQYSIDLAREVSSLGGTVHPNLSIGKTSGIPPALELTTEIPVANPSMLG